MVGTFNMEKDRLFERQLSSWPSNSNPSFHGVVNPNMNENMLQQSEPPWPEDDIEAGPWQDFHYHACDWSVLTWLILYSQKRLLLTTKAIQCVVNPIGTLTSCSILYLGYVKRRSIKIWKKKEAWDSHVFLCNICFSQLCSFIVSFGWSKTWKTLAFTALGRMELFDIGYQSNGSVLSPKQGTIWNGCSK